MPQLLAVLKDFHALDGLSGGKLGECLAAGQRDNEGLCEELGRLMMLFTSGLPVFLSFWLDGGCHRNANSVQFCLSVQVNCRFCQG